MNRQEYNQYEPTALVILSEKFVTTKAYVRECLSGRRKSQKAKKIRKEYPLIVSEIDKNIDKLKNADIT